MTDSHDHCCDTAALALRSHPGCFVCGGANLHGLHLCYESQPDGGIAAAFLCEACYQGYPGLLHGGIIAALLDGAMTHCLFDRGVEAVTARLNVKYRRPVKLGLPVRVQAHLSYDAPPLYRVQAEVVQEGETRAEAEGTFLRADDLPAPHASV